MFGQLNQVKFELNRTDILYSPVSRLWHKPQETICLVRKCTGSYFKCSYYKNNVSQLGQVFFFFLESQNRRKMLI